MSSYSDYIKSVKNNQMSRFFNGGYEMKTNKYFVFKHYIDDDNIIVVTANVRRVKDSLVLVVDDDKAVYLKDWQVCAIRNYDLGIYAYAVKLSRNYFKTYTFRNPFDDFAFDDPDTFDSLVSVAKEQDEANMSVALD